MTSPNAKKSNKGNRRPRVGRLYIQGVATYLKYRLLDVGTAVIRFVTAPFRNAWAQLEMLWFRLKPWLARNKRRLIWSALALLFLSLIVGGSITLYLWRSEGGMPILRLQEVLARLVARLRWRAEPVVVVATQAVEETSVPVMPSVDGAGQ